MSQSSVEYLESSSAILYNFSPSIAFPHCVWGLLNFTQSGLVILVLPWAPQILYRTDCLSFYTEAFPLFQLYTNICSALRCFSPSVDHRDAILVFMSSLFSARLLPLYNVCVCWVLLLRFTQLLLWANGFHSTGLRVCFCAIIMLVLLFLTMALHCNLKSGDVSGTPFLLIFKMKYLLPSFEWYFPKMTVISKLCKYQL